MYNDDVLRIPANEAELWKVLEEQFEYIVQVLDETPVETKKDALENRHHAKNRKGQVVRDGFGLIRFKNVSKKYDNRDHYLDMGRQLLPCIEQALDQRQLTPEFVQQWGKLMFCHGYIAAYIFDDPDDLHAERAGLKTGAKRSKDTQRKWFAHILLSLINKGHTRQQAEDKVADYIEGILAAKNFPPGFDRDWFASMLKDKNNEDVGLAATYDYKHFSKKTMLQLVQERTDDIPPIPEIP